MPREIRKRPSQWLIELRLPKNYGSRQINFSPRDHHLTWNSFLEKQRGLGEKIECIRKDGGNWMLSAEKPGSLQKCWAFEDKVIDFLKPLQKRAVVWLLLVPKTKSTNLSTDQDNINMDDDGDDDAPQVDYIVEVDLKPFIQEPDSSIIITGVSSLAHTIRPEFASQAVATTTTTPPSRPESSKQKDASVLCAYLSGLTEVEAEELKPKVVKRLVNDLSNEELYAVAEEMHQLIHNRKWWRNTKDLPFTRAVVQFLFSNAPGFNTFSLEK